MEKLLQPNINEPVSRIHPAEQISGVQRYFVKDRAVRRGERRRGVNRGTYGVKRKGKSAVLEGGIQTEIS